MNFKDLRVGEVAMDTLSWEVDAKLERLELGQVSFMDCFFLKCAAHLAHLGSFMLLLGGLIC